MSIIEYGLDITSNKKYNYMVRLKKIKTILLGLYLVLVLGYYATNYQIVYSKLAITSLIQM